MSNDTVRYLLLVAAYAIMAAGLVAVVP